MDNTTTKNKQNMRRKKNPLVARLQALGCSENSQTLTLQFRVQKKSNIKIVVQK